MNCPSCGVSNPDGAAFCQSCGTRVSAAPVPPAPAPAYVPAPAAPQAAYPQAAYAYAQPLRPAKPALGFLPSALSAFVLPLACVSFGVGVLDWILDRADGQTMFLGALIPLVQYGCSAALFVALWDGLRRLSHPLAGLAGLCAAAETIGCFFLSAGGCLTNVPEDELGLASTFCSTVGLAFSSIPVGVSLAVMLALGVGLLIRHAGRGRLLGIALTMEALVGSLLVALLAYGMTYAVAEAASGSFDEDTVDVIGAIGDFFFLLCDGFLLFALCWVLSSVFRPRVPQPPAVMWPPAPCAPPSVHD